MTLLHVANGRLFGGIERMLTTLAACEGADLEFVVATEGRLLSELRDRHARVHFFGDVRLSHPSSLLRARHHFRRLLRRRSYGGVVCHAPWSHAIFAGVARSCGLPAILWQPARRWSNGRAARPAQISSSATADGRRRQPTFCSRAYRIESFTAPLPLPGRLVTLGPKLAANLEWARTAWWSCLPAEWSHGRDT